MSKIEFDKYGNPSPYEVIKLSYIECEDVFVNSFPNSMTRKNNWTNFLKFHNDLEIALNTKSIHWIDGSFITNKLNPNDIDVVTFLDESCIESAFTQFDMNHSNPQGLPKITYNVDNYIIFNLPNSHKYSSIMKERTNYWMKWFGMDRAGNPKSIVEVAL